MINYNPKSLLNVIFALMKGEKSQILKKKISSISLFKLLISNLLVNYFPNTISLKKLIFVNS